MVDKKPQINIIFAKSRIAPKRTLSVPRLELMALLIGVRSLKFVSKEPIIKGTKKIIWDNSQCVLNWLTSKKPLSVFVKNRIAKITKEKNLECRHINTKENASDIPSRGVNSTELKDCSFWWNGPKWLETGSTSWPTWNVQRFDQKITKQTQSE